MANFKGIPDHRTWAKTSVRARASRAQMRDWMRRYAIDPELPYFRKQKGVNLPIVVHIFMKELFNGWPGGVSPFKTLTEALTAEKDLEPPALVNHQPDANEKANENPNNLFSYHTVAVDGYDNLDDGDTASDGTAEVSTTDNEDVLDDQMTDAFEAAEGTSVMTVAADEDVTSADIAVNADVDHLDFPDNEIPQIIETLEESDGKAATIMLQLGLIRDAVLRRNGTKVLQVTLKDKDGNLFINAETQILVPKLIRLRRKFDISRHVGLDVDAVEINIQMAKVMLQLESAVGKEIKDRSSSGRRFEAAKDIVYQVFDLSKLTRVDNEV
ncbi:hypothetical protein P280DRAFT_475777 [Massarina eburnea CBS 473.64]|uniref:Uncharacterized protein n=1 Tax=Massarina eburnea CBS 473.64 TaxID=1395130 RepID=A0A6A6SG29_9PLEO|nr:hypothetical protein P280DRAFT_475777 [Massarina eburnea CBS 473.64]